MNIFPHVSIAKVFSYEHEKYAQLCKLSVAFLNDVIWWDMYSFTLAFDVSYILPALIRKLSLCRIARSCTLCSTTILIRTHRMKALRRHNPLRKLPREIVEGKIRQTSEQCRSRYLDNTQRLRFFLSRISKSMAFHSLFAAAETSS